MPRHLPRRLAAVAATAVALLLVPATSPASAAEARVMQWHAFGTWGCGPGCGNGGASLSGSSGSCGQTGADLDTAGAPRLAVNYGCSASFSGTPTGVCAAGVCAVAGGSVSVTVSDPNAGGSQSFSGLITGATVSTTPAGARALTIVSTGVTSTTPVTVWSLEAVLEGWNCSVASVQCAGVAPAFALSLTQTWAGP